MGERAHISGQRRGIRIRSQSLGLQVSVTLSVKWGTRFSEVSAVRPTCKFDEFCKLVSWLPTVLRTRFWILPGARAHVGQVRLLQLPPGRSSPPPGASLARRGSTILLGPACAPSRPGSSGQRTGPTYTPVTAESCIDCQTNALTDTLSWKGGRTRSSEVR